MLSEIVHFLRVGKQVSRMQKQMQLPPAQFIDWITARADDQGWGDIRRELVGDLRGRVLEIGCGTGAMFEHFGSDAQVEGIEPEADLLELAIPRAERSGGRIHAADGDGMQLAFADGSFDAVVFGMVLCSVPSVQQVLAEANRVLKPGGLLRALEHVRSEQAVSGFLMNLTNPFWVRLNNQGCCWNRNPLGEMEAAGFHLDDVRSFQRFDTLVPAFPMRRVRAHKITR
jgi:ubiquinone/menaquinone biosynthesis C-methylase UbiE